MFELRALQDTMSEIESNTLIANNSHLTTHVNSSTSSSSPSLPPPSYQEAMMNPRLVRRATTSPADAGTNKYKIINFILAVSVLTLLLFVYSLFVLVQYSCYD